MASIIEIQTDLQNLTKQRITQQEIANIIGVGQNAISGRAKRNSEFSEDEIISLQNHYNVIIEDGNITLDYYPDIFGSCGNGVMYITKKPIPSKVQAKMCEERGFIDCYNTI